MLEKRVEKREVGSLKLEEKCVVEEIELYFEKLVFQLMIYILTSVM